MRFFLLIVVGLLIAASCNKATEEQGPVAGEQARAPEAAAEPVNVQPADTADASAGAAGVADEDWPEHASVYPGSEIMGSGWQDDPMGRMFDAIMESDDTIEAVKAYYEDKLKATGMRQVEETISPQQNGCAFQHDSSLVYSVRAMAAEEKTMIQFSVIPSPLKGDLPVSVNWFGLDDVPPDFPSDLLPRYPGATIEGASITSDVIYNIELATADSPDDVFAFFDSHFAGLGWQAEQSGAVESITAKRYTKDGASIDLYAEVEEQGGTRVGLFYQTKDAGKLREGMGDISTVATSPPE